MKNLIDKIKSLTLHILKLANEYPKTVVGLAYISIMTVITLSLHF